MKAKGIETKKLDLEMNVPKINKSKSNRAEEFPHGDAQTENGSFIF